MKIGLIKEGKTPPDKRVALTPAQCKEVLNQYPDLELVVQPSPIRKFKDAAYADLGIPLQEDLSDCDVIIGVKEVNVEDLIPNKRFFFFSHTFKEQPYNRDLLQAVIDKNISLIDWEVLTNPNGIRLIGFGRYAGIVGCYNGFLAYGERTGAYHLKAANQCEDRVEMESELAKIVLPKSFKIAITGAGRVAKGAMEILDKAGIKKVSPTAYLTQQFEEPVYTQLLVSDYNKTADGRPFDKNEFYTNPKPFESDFFKYATVTNLFIPCHYWDAESPYIFTRKEAKHPDFNIEVVADISCDIDCAVASTLRPSTIADPLYGYSPQTESEVAFNDAEAITVMAVDNLPCELPKDASEDFGKELISSILPALLGADSEGIIARATMTKDGKLTEKFSYLDAYLKRKA